MPLRTLWWPVLAFGAFSCVEPASAQVEAYPSDVQPYGGPPDIAFDDEPGLVEVEPGVAVVPDIDQEVFFVNGAYWCYWDGAWFRSGSWRGGWAAAPPPPRLAAFPRGRYMHWHDGRMFRPGRGVMIRGGDRFRGGDHFRDGEHYRNEDRYRQDQQRAVQPRVEQPAPPQQRVVPQQRVAPQQLQRPSVQPRVIPPAGRSHFVTPVRPTAPRAMPPRAPIVAPSSHRPSAPAPAPVIRGGHHR